MPGITVTEKDYLDKTYACWLGKCIGGTLGRPLEGKRGPHRLSSYGIIPAKPVENDDLDIQLVWLHAVRERGIELTSRELALEWLDHVIYWFDEYRFATANLRKGLLPPMSGWFNNWFKDCMRSPIRSEIWAMISPGSPQTAVAYAYQDAILDHSDEGVYGELFLAAIESAGYVVADAKKLLQIGLSAIPSDCRVSKAVRDVMQWHEKKIPAEEARSTLLEAHGSRNFSDAPQNLGIITLAWLYGGGDFEKGILAAVNCGLDTGCNAGSLGALLGILGGQDGIPVKWKAPIKGRITPGHGIVGFEPPSEIELLTEETFEVAKAVLEGRKTGVHIVSSKGGGRRSAPSGFGSDLTAATFSDDFKLSQEHRLGAATLNIRFQKYPTISYDRPAELEFIVSNSSEKGVEGHVDFTVPWGWQLEPEKGFDFSVKKRGKPFSARLLIRVDERRVQLFPVNPLSAHVSIRGQEPVEVDFVLLGERRWLIAGPYGKKGDRAFERVYLPEKAAREEAGGKVVFRKASFPEFLTDVNPFFGQKKEGVIYALGWFYSSRKRDVRLCASCSDGIKVWLNDRLILSKHEHFPIRPPQYRVDIQVQRGWNRLLLKVARCAKPVDLHFYFADRKNHVFDDLIDTYLPAEVLSLAG